MSKWQGITSVFVAAMALFVIERVSLSAAAPPGSESGMDITGIWQGTLHVSSVELRLIFKISEKSHGIWSATLDSPDQGAQGIPVDRVALEGRSLLLEVKPVRGAFKGEISDDSTIQGKWEQGGMSLPLVLKRVDKVPEIHRPQEPKKPYPYEGEEIVYQNKTAGIKLAGTLTLPRGGGPFPAVLLISGSGPQDRDETVLDHRPFLVLADYMTRRGIAVLRVDDRGVGGSTGNFSEGTSADFTGDALAGVEYLKSRKDIDSKQIGLVGHSEGGLIAPRAAVQSPDVAFVVMMAGTGLTGEEVMYLQGEKILRAAGATDSIIAFAREAQERNFAVIKQEENKAIAEKKLLEIRAWQEQEKEKLSRRERKWLESFGDTSEAEMKLLLSPWFREFLIYDPRPTLAKVKCPILAVVGELDLQVAPKENLLAIEKALQTGGNEHYVIKELPKLNHLFQTAETGAPSEYGKIEETFSPKALKFVTDWILHQTKQAAE